jgi:transcription-repair coupling factor (superfamily II helicase)
VQTLLRRLEQGGAWFCPGVSGAAQPFLVALLQHRFPHRIIVAVTDSLKAQEGFHQDLQTWMGSSWSSPNPPSTLRSPPSPLFYPAWDVLPQEAKLPHADVISERLETLVALAAPDPALARTGTGAAAPVAVASVVALLERTFAPAELRQRTRQLRRGDRMDPLDLVEWLEHQAYEPEAQVTQKGEWAQRGGILDVFSPTHPWPVRLEFFGDDLESLRWFDPQTQISRDEVPAITLGPAGELGLLRQRLTGEGAPPPAGACAPPSPATLLDHLPSDAVLVLCEPEALAESARLHAAQVSASSPFHVAWEDLQRQIAARGVTCLSVQDSEVMAPAPEVQPATGASSEHRHLPPARSAALDRDATTPRFAGSVRGGRAEELTDLPREALQPPSSDLCPLPFSSLDTFRPVLGRASDPQVAEIQRRAFFDQLHRWLRQDHAVHVFCNNEGERQRFLEIWQEYGLGEDPSGSPDPKVPRRALPGPAEPAFFGLQPATHLGTLARGFLCAEAKVVVVTDAEIFGRYRAQRPRRLKSPHAAATRSMLDIDFTELEEGDYVVHVQHGVGRYLGLKILPTQTRRDKTRLAIEPASPPTDEAGEECLVIEYAPSDPEQPPPRLYVPVAHAHLVGKYVGAGKVRPPLNTLGGTRWARAKAQAERAVRDLAGELLAIQAARESQAGHAFPADAPWQREFEGAFLYEETPDQRRAILETKADLERPRPMDRLICGDVGFGKTEVALRAAFKAVLGGKQVAVLVPTTVLAQQHFNTFRERMADYPIRIELLSRFRTRREQQRVIRDLAAGAVDLVIGTHRLVQGDAQFKDLGLVVIDEEQRFGVLHKERFKQLRQLVDVLTLSATPIPRTLYLALTGARDMSTIETPPQDRLPVETLVTAYDERVIRDAIQRELNRGGQVFFLHNRVTTIDRLAVRLQQLVPQARILVGHGQMPSDDLEDVMTRFVNGEADVLLSTTIIESGLDIPNANTILIDRADRFGLSDLYQLRGRVGRHTRQAYAYLLLPRHAGLLADARKRLSAIRQYSSLGSGFKIAMRDLEIRGAGNLLGPEQSGHITAVGFELYCQLLKQSVSALKGEKVKPRIDVVVRLDFLALSPEGTDAQGPSAGDRKPGPDHSSLVTHNSSLHRTAAYLPLSYIPDARQRIEVYRKLAQATDLSTLENLSREVRDRFGRRPPAVDRLLQVAELKILAGDRAITVLETQQDRLILTRHGDYLMVGGKFPRLTKKEAKARLNEIKKRLLAL